MHASPQNPFFERTPRCFRILSSMSPLAVVRASIFVLCSDDSSIAARRHTRGASLLISALLPSPLLMRLTGLESGTLRKMVKASRHPERGKTVVRLLR